MSGFFFIPLVFMGIGMLVSWKLKRSMNQYARMPLQKGWTGKEVAERMLHDNGIRDVRIVSVAGFLTDHYNPSKKTINLSQGVFNSPSVAAAAIAAHETGHAVQHAKAYGALKMRSALVPIAKVGGYISSFVMMGGLYMLESNPIILLIGVLGYGAMALFSVVTLPVEFDASKRALAWLRDRHIASGDELSAAKSALKWAAMTYVVAALSSITQLLYLVMLFRRRR